jgi:hypothetical protein
MNLAQQVRAWRERRLKLRAQNETGLTEVPDANSILHRCRYVFNIAQIDNGFLVFYTGNTPNLSAFATTYGGPVGSENTNIRYCKDINELPDIVTGLTAQLRLNL